MTARLFVCLLVLLCLAPLPAQAMTVPVKLHHQGRLLDDAGDPVNVPVEMVLRIYSSPAGGSPLWEETMPAVPVTDGLFSVILGSAGSDISPDVFADPMGGGVITRYLEVVVEGETLPERFELAASPFAVAAYRMAGDVHTMMGSLTIPDPIPADMNGSSVQLSSGSGLEETGIIIVETRPGPVGGMDSGSVKISALPGGENGIIIVETRPGEEVSSSIETSTGLGGGEEVGIIIVETRPGAGAGGGMDSGVVTLSADAVDGCALDLNVRSGIEPEPFVHFMASPDSGSSMTLEVQNPSGIAPCVKAVADPNLGSSLQLDLHSPTGILPCIRMSSALTDTKLSVIRKLGAPGGGSQTPEPLLAPALALDSVSIVTTADSAGAEIELFAGAAFGSTTVVLRADDTEGRVGINTASPQVALDVVGDICVTGSVGACSDVRFKEDVRTIEDALDKLERLRGVDFEWRRDEFEQMQFEEGRHLGVLAQDVEAVFPELVDTRTDGYKTVDYSKLTAVLIEAVKELKVENEELKFRLQRLEASDRGVRTR